MPTQALGCFLKGQACTLVADLTLHPARCPSLVHSPQRVIGRFTVRTALLCCGHLEALVIRAHEPDWPHQGEQVLGTFSHSPLAMSAPPLAPGYWPLLTQPTVEDPFHCFLNRCSHCLFPLLIRFHLGSLLSGRLFYR